MRNVRPIRSAASPRPPALSVVMGGAVSMAGAVVATGAAVAGAPASDPPHPASGTATASATARQATRVTLL